MKKIFLFAIIFTLTTGIGIYSKPNVTPAPQVSFGINFDFFYNSLSPHGEWLSLSSGVYAWRPFRISYGWRPYSNGRWVWTTQGWYWDSYENFGWATYHYGRWFNDDYYGWIWTPDYEWAPAWVEWRYDDDYIGWAPLPPYAGFRNNFGIYFNNNWVSPYHYWNFVGYNHFCHNNVNIYLVNDRYRYRVYNNSKYRNNYSYNNGKIINNGMERDFIERKTGQSIAETRVMTSSRLRNNAGDRGRNSVEIYTPSRDDIQKNRVDRYDIKENTRRTSLDVSKIEVNRDKTDIDRKIMNRSERPTGDRQNIDRTNSGENNLNRDRQDTRINRDGESMRQNTERQSTPDNYRVIPKREVERSQIERQRTEQPRYEAPKIESRQETPRYESPKYEAPKVERRPEQPVYKAPAYEAPKVERRQETPKYEAPKVDRRQETPRNETPRIERRQESPRMESPSGNQNSNNSERRRSR